MDDMLLTFVTYMKNKTDKNQKLSQGLFFRQRMYPTKEDFSSGFGRKVDPENPEKIQRKSRENPEKIQRVQGDH